MSTDAMEKSGLAGGVGTPLPHDSAHLHVTGEALYTDDIPEVRGTLHAAIGMSERAHARIKSIDLAKVRAAPGVVAVLTAKDVPGKNDYGPVIADDPIFATTLVQYHGQSIFAVAARTVDEARRAARLAVVEYEDLKPILTADAAVRAESFVLPTERMQRGDPAAAIAAAPHRLAGRIQIGGQEQFYLEGMIAYAVPKEDGTMLVYSSTQHPGEIQHQVAHALDVDANDVVVDCRRMGGGFGGKESQPGLFACIAALFAQRLNRPVKLRADRDDDMMITGKRHDFVTDYEVGFDGDGRILGVTFTLAGRCGYSADLSGSINDRAMFHSDNCYYLSDVGITSYRCKTNTQSNTAFRGFGGPQGMVGIEQVIDEIARHLGKDPLDVRKLNFYGTTERNVTHYQQTIVDNVIHEIVDELEKIVRLPATARGDPVVEPREPASQARHRAHARQVRHFVHGDAPEPGRRADPRLHRRYRAPEPRRHRDGAGPVHEGRPGRRDRARDRRRPHPRHGVRHEQGSERVGDRGLVRRRHQRQGRAGGREGAPRATGGIRRRAFQGRRSGRRVREQRGRDRRADDPVRRARAPCLFRARVAVGDRLLPDAQDRLRPQDVERQPLLLLLLWRRGVGSDRRHADRREPAPARRHPARRRPLAQSGDRHGSDRGRFHPGHGLAHDGAPVVERRAAS